MPFPSPRDLLHPGTEPAPLSSPALAGGVITIVPPGKPINLIVQTIIFLNNKKILMSGTSLVVQWLRLHTPNAGGPGSIPGEPTGCHVLQLLNKSPYASMRILHAATKTHTFKILKCQM